MRETISINLLASNFAYILMPEFSRDIRRKLAGMVGSFPGLGKVTMWALSISGEKEEKEEVSSAFVKTACMCGARIYLNVL